MVENESNDENLFLFPDKKWKIPKKFLEEKFLNIIWKEEDLSFIQEDEFDENSPQYKFWEYIIYNFLKSMENYRDTRENTRPIEELFQYLGIIKSGNLKLNILFKNLLQKNYLRPDIRVYFKKNEEVYFSSYGLIVEYCKDDAEKTLDGVFNQAASEAGMHLEILAECNDINNINDKIPIIGWKGHNVKIGFVTFNKDEKRDKRFIIEDIKSINISDNGTNLIKFAFFLTNLFENFMNIINFSPIYEDNNNFISSKEKNDKSQKSNKKNDKSKKSSKENDKSKSKKK